MKKEEKEEVKETYSIGDELDKAKEYTKMYTRAHNFNQERFDSYAELMAFFQGNQKK